MNNKDIISIVEKIFRKKIRANHNLFEIDSFDSLKFFEMISLIETKMKKKIPNKFINEKNFQSISSICSTLRKIK